jgi:hypothetical protein
MKVKPHTAIILGISTWIILAQLRAYAGSLEDLPWGPPSNGLQVSLTLTHLKTSDLQVAFRNIGNHDVVLNFGYMWANGKVHLPYKIGLIFTDAQGKNRFFKILDVRYPALSGRIDDYIVPLRAGSTYVLALNTDQVRGSNAQKFETALLPGKNRVRVQFQGTGAQFVNFDTEGIKLMKFWLGTAESNVLIIER